MGRDAEIYFTARTLDERTVKLWAFELAVAVGGNSIPRRPDPTATDPWRREGVRAIEPATDNPYDIRLDAGETLYEVNAWYRYYGPGCERGPWPEIAAILYWLIHRLHVDEEDCMGRVYYGPIPVGGMEVLEVDIDAELEDEDEAWQVEEVGLEWWNRMWRYWAEEGRLPFVGDSRTGPVIKDGITPPLCDLCGFHANIYGWGSGRKRLARCVCCNQEWRTDDGNTWIEATSDPQSAASEAPAKGVKPSLLSRLRPRLRF